MKQINTSTFLKTTNYKSLIEFYKTFTQIRFYMLLMKEYGFPRKVQFLFLHSYLKLELTNSERKIALVCIKILCSYSRIFLHCVLKSITIYPLWCYNSMDLRYIVVQEHRNYREILINSYIILQTKGTN